LLILHVSNPAFPLLRAGFLIITLNSVENTGYQPETVNHLQKRTVIAGRIHNRL